MRINYRFLALLAVAVLVLGGIIFVVHRYQQSRSAELLLTQARAANEEGDLGSAAEKYSQYLGLRPKSVEARGELGILLVEAGAYSKAYFNLESALRAKPDDLELREHLVTAALGIGRFQDAKETLEDYLLANDEDNVEYLGLLAVCEQNLGNFEEARGHLEAANEKDEANVEIASALAAMYARRLKQPDKADDLLTKLVEEAAPKDPAARVVRAGWFLERATLATDSEKREEYLATAIEDAKQAEQYLELAEEEQRPKLARRAATLSAEAAMARNDMDTAREAIKQSIEALEAAAAQETEEPGAQELEERAQMYAMAARVELRDPSDREPLAKLEQAIEWLERGLLTYPNNAGLLWDLSLCYLDAELFEKVEGNAETQEKGTKEKLAALDYPPGPLEFLEARLLVAKDKAWGDAIEKLNSARTQLDRNSNLVLQTDLLLAECHRRLENPDQEIQALQRAIDANAFLGGAREALANAYLRTDRLQDAKSEFAKLSAPSAKLSLARIELVEGLKSGNPQAPAFSRVRKLIEELKQEPSVASDVAIMEAELASAQQNADEAEELLREDIKREPKNQSLWLALVNLYLRDDNLAEASRMLDAARAQIPDSADLRIARARVLIANDSQDVDLEKLEQLAQPQEDWTTQEQRRLRITIARMFLALEEHERSLRLLQPLTEGEGGSPDVGVNLLLFDLAYQTGNTGLMESSLDSVEEIEGQGPLWQVGNAIRLAGEAKELPSDKAIAKAQKLRTAIAGLEKAAAMRPTWARIFSLRGELLDIQKKPDQALEDFIKAIELGEANPQLITRTLYLLYDGGEEEKARAERILGQLERQNTALSGDAARLASSLSMQADNPRRALAQYEAHAKSSKDPRERVTLAWLYERNGKIDEAKSEFETAIDLDPTAPTPWVAQVRMLSDAGLQDEARSAIARAEKSIRPAERANALAECYLALGDLESAKTYAQEALAEDPDDPARIRRAAELFVQFANPELALPLLERLAGEDISDGSQADRDWAVRALAMNAANTGDQQALGQSEQRLRKLTSEDPDKSDLENWRALAMLLGIERDGLAEAIAIMEDITRKQTAFSLADQSLLARLYLAQGNAVRYSRLMNDVLSKGGLDSPLLVRQHCYQLLAAGDVGEAQLYFKRLNELEPDSLDTRTLEARLLFASEQYDKLVQLLKSKSSQAEYGEWSARLSELFAGGLAAQGETNQAQQLLEVARAWFEQVSDKESEFKVTLARFHARQGNGEQLVALLKAGTPAEDQLADLGQVAMQSGRMDQEGMQQFLSIVEAAFAKNPESLSLGLCVGDIYGWMLDLDKAETVYRAVLKAHPKHFVALNNLAMVLTMTPAKHSQALRAINDAIDSKGPEDYLLDTRGIVFLALNRPQEAVQDFEAAIKVTQSPDRLFHMAAALQALGKTDEAREFFEQAQAGGVSAKSLHPLEVASFEKLQSQLATRPVSAVR